MFPTLCIVDMQPFYSINYASKSVLPAVLEEIKKAKQRNAGIVLIEFDGSGKSFGAIYDALTDYKRAAKVLKDNVDGSEEFLEVAFANRFNTERVHVCGVYGCQCVFATAQGIKVKSPNSIVSWSRDSIGCWCDSVFQVGVCATWKDAPYPEYRVNKNV